MRPVTCSKRRLTSTHNTGTSAAQQPTPNSEVIVRRTISFKFQLFSNSSPRKANRPITNGGDWPACRYSIHSNCCSWRPIAASGM